MSTNRTGLIVAGVIMASGPLAYAHARLDYPPPRDMSDSHKDSNGGAPCGVARVAAQPSTPLTPGAPATVRWTETVNHPGCFLVDFAAAGDANFQLLANVKHVGTGNTPRAYMQNVTLPAAPCSACTLRVRQIMLGSETAVCPPTPIPTDVTYYTCANVVMAGGGGDAGTPPPADGGGDAGTGTGGGSNATGGSSGGGGRSGAGSGGAPGSGGSVAGATGGSNARGSGGVPSSTSSGGAVGSGGVTGTGGAAQGQGTGGSIATSSGGAAAAGGPSATPAEPAACACTVGGPTQVPAAILLVGLFIAFAVRRTRSRTPHATSTKSPRRIQ